MFDIVDVYSRVAVDIVVIHVPTNPNVWIVGFKDPVEVVLSREDYWMGNRFCFVLGGWSVIAYDDCDRYDKSSSHQVTRALDILGEPIP